MMSSMGKRTKAVTEYVIDLEGGIDAKSFSYWYGQVLKEMTADNVDMSYDDAFTVHSNESELIFRVGNFQ